MSGCCVARRPAELAGQAEVLRPVYAGHRCSVVEDGPGRALVVFHSRDPLIRMVPPIDPAALPALEVLPVGEG